MKILRFLSLALALAALAASAPLLGQQHPTVARGFAAEKSFQVGDVDNVNLFNGNLTLTLSIGPRFKTGGSFEYGLTLVYNSNVWEIDDLVQETQGWTIARTHPLDNAGLGWNLSLGRLLQPGDPNNDRLETYNYIAPDGSEHRFAETLRPGQPIVAGVKYSLDNSFLRLVLLPAVNPNYAEVHFPDGNVHIFAKNANFDWRLQTIRDPYNNYLQIAYTSPTLWTLTDNFLRTHTIEFQTLGAGEARRTVVSRVNLLSPLSTSPTNNLASYTFNYTQPLVQRGCPNHPPSGTSQQVQPPLLASIVLPDASRYVVDTATDFNPLAECSQTSGRISKLTLPTGGFYSWTYRQYLLSVAALGTTCADRSPILRETYGVGTRTMSTGGANAVAGTWTYVPAYRAEPISPSQRCNAPREAWTTVEDPLGDKTVHFFTVFRKDDDQVPNVEGWLTYEFGLPLTRYSQDGAGRFLSKEFYDCPSSGTPLANCTKLRRSFVRYETSGGFETSPIDPRVASERTFYLDDVEGAENVWSSTDNSLYDGLGHYRQTTTDGNFIAGRDNSRTTFTRYNDTATGDAPIPGASAPWILGTYTEQWTEARKNSQAPSNLDRETSQFCFDGTKGVLLRKRTLLGNSPQANDVLTEYEHNAKGDLIAEKHYGGDTQSLGLGGLCTLSRGAPTYALDRTIPLPRSANDASWTISATPTGSGFKTEDVDIHPRSGVVVASRDTAGVQTNYQYDLLSHFAQAQTPDSATTQVIYTLPTAANPNATPKVEVLQKNPTNHQELTRTEYLFDGLGRLKQERRRTAGTNASGTFSVRETQYDAMGHVISVSEWGNGSTAHLAKKTTFSNFDPFGRAKTTTSADGATHETTYVGVRKVTKKSWVATALDGTETASCRIERSDRYGRLTEVDESATATCSQEGQYLATRYGYDVGNRLTWARTVDPATPTQFREWIYDHRGFLLWEDSPEKLTSTQASCPHDVCFAEYDAKGHAHRKLEGAFDLTYDFDSAERPLRVRTTGSATTCSALAGNCYTEYSYGSGTTASDRSLGKVKTSRRYSGFLDAAGSWGFISQGIVQNTYTYGGRDGALSKKVFGVSAPWVFETRQTLDLLGNLETVTYPFGPGGVTEATHFYIDVPASNPVRSEIDDVGIAHYVDSCAYNAATGENSYCPNNTMTRGELATPLLRAKYSNGNYVPPTCTSSGFTDVACSASYGPWVAKAQQDGLLSACGTGLYCPTQNATRATLARFLLKAIDGSNYNPPACTSAMFSDVPCSDPDAAWINEFARRGLGGGCGNGSFCPSQAFNRSELARALSVGKSLESTIKPSTQRVVQYAYDNGLLQRVEMMGMPSAKLTYGANLALTQVVHGNGVVDTITADPQNLQRPRAIVSTDVAGATLWSTGNYLYDSSGNIKKIGANSYTYDRLSRLVDARFFLEPTSNTTQRGQTYNFDAFGNINNFQAVLAESSGYTTPTDPATNRLSGAGVTYDEQGNLKTWNGNIYKFDALNNLISYTNSTGENWAYFYDADGERVLTFRKVNTPNGVQFQERWTLRDPAGRVLREIYRNGATTNVLDPSLGNEMNDYIYRGNQVTAIEMPRAARHLSLDHLGTPRLLTNRRGVTTAYHVYYPFGEEATAFNQDVIRAKFTGHERDLNSPIGTGDDLDYMHARYYSPISGRFLSVDRVMGRFSRPLSLNRYTYGFLNPVKMVDPDGNSSVVFNKATQRLTLYLADGSKVGRWNASNHPSVSRPTIQPLQPGTYTFQDKSRPHTHGAATDPSGTKKDSFEGSFGQYGIVRLDPFRDSYGSHSGVGIHSGRDGFDSQGNPIADRVGRTDFRYGTQGCIRTCDEAMSMITLVMQGDPLTTLTVINEPNEELQEKAALAVAIAMRSLPLL